MLALALERKAGSGEWTLGFSLSARKMYPTMTRFTDRTASNPLQRVKELEESSWLPGTSLLLKAYSSHSGNAHMRSDVHTNSATTCLTPIATTKTTCSWWCSCSLPRFFVPFYGSFFVSSQTLMSSHAPAVVSPLRVCRCVCARASLSLMLLLPWSSAILARTKGQRQTTDRGGSKKKTGGERQRRENTREGRAGWIHLGEEEGEYEREREQRDRRWRGWCDRDGLQDLVWKTRTKQQQEAEALFSLLGIPTLQAEILKTMLQQQQQVEDLIWRQVCNLPAVASSAHSTRENFLLLIPPSSLLIRSMDCFLAV